MSRSRRKPPTVARIRRRPAKLEPAPSTRAKLQRAMLRFEPPIYHKHVAARAGVSRVTATMWFGNGLNNRRVHRAAVALVEERKRADAAASVPTSAPELVGAEQTA